MLNWRIQEDLEARIDKYLVEIAGVSKEMLSDRTAHMSKLGIDSLSVVEMLFEIEDHYGFHIDDAMKYKDMALGEVIAELVGLIEKRDSSGKERMHGVAGA
jgi:acyl carrier protein